MSKKRCPFFKECHGSCFDTMLKYCFSEKYEECNMYIEQLLKKILV